MPGSFDHDASLLPTLLIVLIIRMQILELLYDLMVAKYECNKDYYFPKVTELQIYR